MAVNEKIRIRLKSYDHTLIDTAAEKIVDVAKRHHEALEGSRRSNRCDRAPRGRRDRDHLNQYSIGQVGVIGQPKIQNVNQ